MITPCIIDHYYIWLWTGFGPIRTVRPLVVLPRIHNYIYQNNHSYSKVTDFRIRSLFGILKFWIQLHVYESGRVSYTITCVRKSCSFEYNFGNARIWNTNSRIRNFKYRLRIIFDILGIINTSTVELKNSCSRKTDFPDPDSLKLSMANHFLIFGNIFPQ